MKRKIGAALIIVCIISVFFTIPAYGFEGYVTINSSSVNIRSGPGTGYSVVYQASLNETFSVIEQDGQWYKVRIGDKQGWVAGWLVSKNPAPERNAFVTASILNVRKAPDVTSEVVGRLEKNSSIIIIGEKNGWYEISGQGGIKGWISSDYASETMSSVISSEGSRAIKARINGTRVNLRTGPGMDYPVIGSLSNNKEVTLIFKQGDWYQILYNDKPAWVASWLTDFTGDDSFLEGTPYVLMPMGGINLRSGPDINSSVLGKGEEAERFNILGKNGDWYRIALKNGVEAHVANWVVMPVGVELPIPDYYIGNILEGLTIVVDPGHGGEDPGAIGLYYKTLEKDVNLATARILERKLLAAGAHVIMTRSTDKFVPLKQIAQISNNSGCDAFVSIHYNMNNSRSLRGTEVYYYSGTQNGSFAKAISTEIAKRSSIPMLGVKRASFVVLRENKRLAVLVEGAFLSNSNDEALARSQDFQQKIAEGIFQGIIAHFKR